MKLQPQDNYLFIDGDHSATMRENHYTSFTCVGDYNSKSYPYICRTLCNFYLKCRAVTFIRKGAIEELPQFLTHKDPEVRKLAKRRLEELKSVTNSREEL